MHIYKIYSKMIKYIYNNYIHISKLYERVIKINNYKALNYLTLNTIIVLYHII